jgi:hypothetical protein
MEYNFRTASVKILPDIFNIEDIQKIQQVPFSQLNESEGFRLLSYSENNKFLFQYLREVPITYRELNGNYSFKTEKTIKEMIFEIDLKSKTMIVFSNKSQSDFFIRKFIGQFGHLVSSLEVDFSKLVSALIKSKFIVHSEQIVINGFIFKEVMIGKYIAEIRDIEVLQHILSEYGPKVDKIKLSIQSDTSDDIYLVSINRTGSFLFNSFREGNNYIAKYLISQILEGR